MKSKKLGFLTFSILSICLTSCFSRGANFDYNKVTIKFVNYNDELLQEEKVKIGEVPVFKGQNPTKPDEGYKSYVFSGWDPKIEAATEDATYKAVFSETLKEYTITYHLDNGEDDIVERRRYGETLDPVTPVKDVDRNRKYTFVGWTPELATVTEDATYTALYECSGYDISDYGTIIPVYSTSFEGFSLDASKEYICEVTPFFYNQPGIISDGFKVVDVEGTKMLKYVTNGTGISVGGYGNDTTHQLTQITVGNKYHVSYRLDCHFANPASAFFQCDYMTPSGRGYKFNGIELRNGVITPHEDGVVFNCKYEDGVVSYDFIPQNTEMNYFAFYIVNGAEGDYFTITDFEIAKSNLVYYDDFSTYAVGTPMSGIAHFYNDEGVATASIKQNGDHKVLNISNANTSMIWPKFYFNNLPFERNVTYTFCITFEDDTYFDKLYVGGPYTDPHSVPVKGPQLRFTMNGFDGYELEGDDRFEGPVKYFDGVNLEFDYTVPSEGTWPTLDFPQVEFIVACPPYSANLNIKCIQIYKLYK